MSALVALVSHFELFVMVLCRTSGIFLAAPALSSPVVPRLVKVLACGTVAVCLLPMAASEGLAVTPYSPLAGGLLTGKYADDGSSAPGRLNENSMYARRYGDRQMHEIARRFAALAADRGHAPAGLGVAWVAAHPAVTAPIIGPRTLEQLTGAAEALDLRLEEATSKRLDEIWPGPGGPAPEAYAW